MLPDQAGQMSPELMQMLTALGSQQRQGQGLNNSPMLAGQQASLGNAGMPVVKPNMTNANSAPSFIPPGQGGTSPGLEPSQGMSDGMPPQVTSMINSLQSGGVPAATGKGITTPPGVSLNNFSNPVKALGGAPGLQDGI